MVPAAQAVLLEQSCTPAVLTVVPEVPAAQRSNRLSTEMQLAAQVVLAAQ